MRISAAAPIVALLFASASFAQPQLSSQVLTFNNADAPADMQAITNAIRTTLQIPQTSFDAVSRSLTIQATPAGAALAQWLFQSLDNPPSPPPQDLQVDRNPGSAGPGDRLFVFHLAHVTGGTPNFQEIINAARTVPELTRVFPVLRGFSIAVRGDEDRLGLAEWLIRQFDQPPAPLGQPRVEHYHPLHYGSETSVMYFAQAANMPAWQPVVNAMRVIALVTKVFPVVYGSAPAVAVSGAADGVALAEWIFGQLDLSGPGSAFNASAVYQAAPGAKAAQIFFLPGSVTEQNFQAIVTTLRAISPAPLTFPDTFARALVVRGTPAQLEQAGQIIAQAGKF